MKASPFLTISSLITKPFQTFRRLTLTNPVLAALLVVVGTIITLLINQWASHHKIYSTNPAAFTTLIPFYILVFMTGNILLAAIWHMTADILGGAGRGLTLQYFVSLATLPLWITGPAAILLKIFLAMDGFYPIILGLLFSWTIFLLTAAIKELYRFSLYKALLNLFLGPVLLTAIASIILLLIPENIQFPW
ncbi:YIP1 family protein [bacterium]|nr:YIP1 family protein [bacterium]